MLCGDLLGHRLEDRMIVGGGHGILVAEADLMLPEAALALDRLDIDPCGVRPVADLAQQRFDPAAAHDREVDVVLAGSSKITIVSVPGVLVAGVKCHELQLGARQNGIASIGRGLQLLLQDRPW